MFSLHSCNSLVAPVFGSWLNVTLDTYLPEPPRQVRNASAEWSTWHIRFFREVRSQRLRQHRERLGPGREWKRHRLVFHSSQQRRRCRVEDGCTEKAGSGAHLRPLICISSLYRLFVISNGSCKQNADRQKKPPAVFLCQTRRRPGPGRESKPALHLRSRSPQPSPG